MTNADRFKTIFGLYATELWAMPEKEFLKWLNADATDLVNKSGDLVKDLVNDCISRQAAVKALEETKQSDPFNRYEYQNIGIDWSIDAIKALPSAQLAQDLTNGCTDTISRQAAIDMLKNRWKKTRNYEGIGDDIAEECELYLKQVPSAQPEIIYCGECKYMMPNGKCRQFADSTIRPSASDFCSAGERKDNG